MFDRYDPNEFKAADYYGPKSIMHYRYVDIASHKCMVHVVTDITSSLGQIDVDIEFIKLS